MKVDFKKSFARDLKKIKDKELLGLVRKAIEEVEGASQLQMINNLKHLKGENGYFRTRLREYRVGLKLNGDIVLFVRFLHRKEIYRYFP